MDRQIIMYQEFKKILTIISDGDSILSKAMRSALTVEQIKVMQEHVEECEDWGIHLLAKKTQPN